MLRVFIPFLLNKFNLHSHGLSFASLGFRVGIGRDDFILGLDNGDVVGQGLLGSGFAGWVIGQHNLNLDAQNTLPQEDVSAGGIDIVVAGVTAVDHEAIDKLHGLGSLKAHNRKMIIYEACNRCRNYLT